MMKSLRKFALMFAMLIVGTLSSQAETFTEDFESVTITDADSWGYGTTLSNGWAIIGGQVSGTANTAYTLALKEESTYLGKNNSKGLAALYGSSNNAFIVTNEVSGKVTLNVANYGTAAASIYVYEAVADGNTYTKGATALYSKTWVKNTNRRSPVWEDAEFDLGSTPKRLAIVMVKATMDNFAAGEDNVAPVKAPNLNITSGTPASTVTIEDGAYVTVLYENNGEADAENATLTLYVDGQVNKVESLGTIATGAKNGFKSIAYDMTKITAGTYPVYVALTADNDEGDGMKQTTPTDVTFQNKVVEATYTITAENVTVAYDATSYNVNATVTCSIDATDVAVELLDGTTVLATTTVDLTANTPTEVTLTVNGGPFTAGSKDMQVVVANKTGKWIKVTVEEAPVTPVYDLAITEVLGTLDLGNESNNVRITVKNNGNQAITNAPVTLKAGEKVLGTATVSAPANATGFCTIAVASEGLTAGELAVTATVEVEGDATPTDNTMEATLTVVAAAAPEATFSVTAENVTVEFGAESFNIVATVKNTSEVAAENVEVKLLKGIQSVDTKTIATLAAGAEETVTFTVTDILEGGKTATYYVQVAGNKAQAEVTVTFEEEPVQPVVDLAITEVLGSIQLGQTNNSVRVSVQNNGTVDIENAVILLSYGETEIGAAAISAKAGKSAFCMVPVATDNLTEGAIDVTATVTVDGDATPADNTLTATIEVKGIVAPEATFSVTAENITVAYGATGNIVAKVKNTSEVDAENVEVTLMQGMTVVETKTITSLAAGAETTVSFAIACTDENEGTSTDYIVNVANKAQAYPTVTFESKPVVDLAITDIQGELSTEGENNILTVFIENKGNVDVENAKVTLTVGIKVYESTITVKAGDNGLCSFTIPAADLSEGTFTVTATVDYEGETTEADNTLSKQYNVSTAIQAVKAQFGENVQIFTLSGKKVSEVRRGQVYIINGKKTLVK